MAQGLSSIGFKQKEHTMKNKHGILEAKTRGVLVGFAVVFAAAIFTLAGCSTDPKTETTNPPPVISGVQGYTYNGATFTPYTTTVATVTANMKDPDGSLGSIGTISAGKLTLNLPATVDDSNLEYEETLDASYGMLSTTPALHLVIDQTDYLDIMYFNKQVSQGPYSYNKGWSYIKHADNTVVTDVSSYKWVITP
jgi:hypothetical protein